MDIFHLNHALPGSLNTTELFELTDQIFTLSDKVLPILNDFRRDILADLKEANLQLGAVIGREKGISQFTPLRGQYDEDRDHAFMQIVRRVQLTVDDDQEDEEQRTAALLVQRVLDNHPKNLHRLNGAKNTAELKVLIPKLRAPDVINALEQLGLKRYLDRLEEANRNYSKIAEQSAKPEGEQEQIPSGVQVARQVRWLGAIFLAALNYGAFKEDAQILELVREIEASSTKFESVALARKTRGSERGTVEEEAAITA